jgi:hypothetical protein
MTESELTPSDAAGSSHKPLEASQRVCEDPTEIESSEKVSFRVLGLIGETEYSEAKGLRLDLDLSDYVVTTIHELKGRGE